jgi:hypothetical protein
MRYKTKKDLIEDIRNEHDKLCMLLAEIPEKNLREHGVWGDDWNINDLVAHLAEWQQMFLDWHRQGKKGQKPQMPAPGYKWNELPRLNQAIWKKHHSRNRSEIQKDFKSGYKQILKLIEELSEESLLSPGHFTWTGKNPLTTYLGPNTASHYRFAIRVIKRWQKQLAGSVKQKNDRKSISRKRPRR